jgi:AcrR family transcriptional regulator
VRGRRRAPRGQGAALRGEVLRAAMDLLAETGSEDAVSLRALAQRVGVSVPSIYLHFADKQALMDAVCGQVFTDLDEAMQEACAGAPDPFEALRRQGVAYVRFALDHPEQYRIVMMRPPGDGARGQDDVVAAAAFGHLLEGVEACVAVGVLEGKPLTLGLQLWSSAHGLASLLIAKPHFPWPPVEQLIDSTICAAGLGLAAQTRLAADLGVPEVMRRLDALR